jgi:hypothetical protein
MRRAWLMVTVLLLVGVSTCLLGSASQSPDTIEQAAAETFAGHGITEPNVRVQQAACMPSRDTCLRVVADVVVSGKSEIGRLACKRYWTGCTLTMAGYGLHLAPVPDVASPTALAMQLRTVFKRALKSAQMVQFA